MRQSGTSPAVLIAFLAVAVGVGAVVSSGGGGGTSHDAGIDVTTGTGTGTSTGTGTGTGGGGSGDGAATPIATILVTEGTFYSTNKTYWPDIEITTTQGYAPFPVFFEGWQSTPRESLIAYYWDFGAGTEGDVGGRTFEGFNAAHVFETPGTYAVSLRVLDASGNLSSATSQTVTVLSRVSKATYYVDSSIGSDSYDGLAQTVGSGHGPWLTAAKALGTLVKGNGVVMHPGDRVLFNRGQTFPLTGNLAYNSGNSRVVNIDHNQVYRGVQYGAYGTGAKPIIQWAGTADLDLTKDPVEQTIGPYYLVGLGGGNIVWSDLKFNWLNSSNSTQLGGLISGYSGWKNILFLRVDSSDANSSLWSWEGLNPAPDGMFTVGCSFDNHVTAASGYGTQIYGGMSRLALINNTFDQSANHIAYLKPVDKGVISHNVFSRPAFGRTALRMTGGPASASGTPGQSGVAIGMTANNVVVSDNRFLGWVDYLIGGAGRGGGTHQPAGSYHYNYRLVEFASNGDGQQIHDWIVFERNVITNFEVGIVVKNSTNMYFRNNLFVSPAAGSAFWWNYDANESYSPIKNMFVYGNTFLTGVQPIDNQNPSWGNRPIIKGSPYAATGDTTFGTADENIQIKDNIIAQYPDGAAKVAVEVTAPIAGLTIDRNVYWMPNVAGGTYMKVGSTLMTLPTWRSSTGYDANSAHANPLFAGGAISELTTGVPGTPASQAACLTEVDTLTTQLKLSSSSPARGTGAGLGAALYYDFLGVTRLVPDLGAFEYVAP